MFRIVSIVLSLYIFTSQAQAIDLCEKLKDKDNVIVNPITITSPEPIHVVRIITTKGASFERIRPAQKKVHLKCVPVGPISFDILIGSPDSLGSSEWLFGYAKGKDEYTVQEVTGDSKYIDPLVEGVTLNGIPISFIHSLKGVNYWRGSYYNK